MAIETFLGPTVRYFVLPRPDLSRGPGARYTDKYYRHLHRPNPVDREIMDKVIPDQIVRDNMGCIVGMR